MLGCVTQYSQSAAHSCEQFLHVRRLGLSHWDPYAVRRCGRIELYYCNMVEWSWWDSSLIWKTNWFPSVLWHCWFGRMTCGSVKIVPDMTYNVFGGTLNLAQWINEPSRSICGWTVLSLYKNTLYIWLNCKCCRGIQRAKRCWTKCLSIWSWLRRTTLDCSLWSTHLPSVSL